MENWLIKRKLVMTFCILYVITVIFVPTGVFASNSTWTGNGTDDNWQTAENWSGNSIPSNDGTCMISFGSSTRLYPVVNGNGPWNIQGILFQWNAAGSYTISGNSLTIEESIATQDGGAERHIINNNITFTSTAPFISTGLARNLSFGGVISSNSPLLVKGNGWGTVELMNGARINAEELEVSAANAPYGPVTLQLDHHAALAEGITLKLTSSTANQAWKAKVNLNFASDQSVVVSQLYVEGIQQPSGTYNATTNPDYFSGTGSLQVSGSTSSTPTPTPTATPTATPTPAPTPDGIMRPVLLELGSNPDRADGRNFKVYRGTCTWAPVPNLHQRVWMIGR